MANPNVEGQIVPSCGQGAQLQADKESNEESQGTLYNSSA